MGSITSADAVLTLAIATLFPTPQQLQGFGVDDIYDIPSIKSVEAMIGVDGKKSSGFVYALVPQTITLQADSPSNRIFQTWWTQMQAAKFDYTASGIIVLRSTGTKYQMINGSLTGYKPAPAAKRTLQPNTYELTWEAVLPSPT